MPKAHVSRRQLKDVIFGEAAINFEEGRRGKKPGDIAAVFNPRPWRFVDL